MSPVNVKLEPLTRKTATTTSNITIDNNNPVPSGSAGSTVLALSGQFSQPEVIFIQESHSPFDDCEETHCGKLDRKAVSISERMIADHRLSCRLCEMVSLLDFD